MFHDNNIWEKKTNSNIIITMGSYDRAECCEIVGLFILSKLEGVFGEGNVGLYRDDGMAVLPKSGPPGPGA